MSQGGVSSCPVLVRVVVLRLFCSSLESQQPSCLLTMCLSHFLFRWFMSCLRLFTPPVNWDGWGVLVESVSACPSIQHFWFVILRSLFSNVPFTAKWFVVMEAQERILPALALFCMLCNSGLNLGTYGLTLLYCWSWWPHFNPVLQLPVCRWTMISCGRTSRRSSRCQWHVPMVHKPSSTSTLGLWSFLFMIAVVNVADINYDIRILLCDDVPWCRFNTRIWSWPEKQK